MNASMTCTATFNKRPDLVVSVLKVPGSAGPGDSISVTDTTANGGQSGAAGPSTTAFYLSTNNTLSTSQDILLGTRTVGAILSGRNDSATTILQIPLGTSGTYWVFALADANNVVAESNETNNATAQRITIGPPDLVVSSLVVPTSATRGATITVTDTTKNSGQGLAAASATRFYLSPTAALGPGAALLSGSRLVGALPPGATSSGSTGLTIDAGTAPGVYYLIAVADGDSAVAEASETNNTAARKITVR
jgi:subtilase family serine protease